METKKKILIVLYYYHPYVSGLSICAKRLAEALVKQGHQVTVVSTQYDTNLAAQEVIEGVTVLRLPVLFRLGKGVISPQFLWSVLRLSNQFDIVNFHLPLAESGLMALFIPKRKIITTYQCDINLGPGLISKIVERGSLFLMDITLRRSRKIVVSSLDYFRHSVYQKYLEKAAEIYPCVPTQEFNKATDHFKLRKKLNLSDSTILVGFVGRIVFEKGINYLLEAIPFLDKALDNYRIVIVGDYQRIAGGSVKEELDHFLEKYPDRIIFTGFLSEAELRQFYSTITVLVLPSIDPLEAFGLVQVEAMCCGVPVIATNLPGVRTIIQKTEFGMLVEPRNPADIAQKVLALIKQPLTSKKFHKKDWDTATSTAQYIQLFNEK